MDNNIPIDKRVATALIYGICTDTMGLTRGVTDKDVDTYSYLFKIADKQILKALEHCSISIDDLKAYANAINSIKVCDNVSFANTGSNCPEALIASISDFMLDLIEVDFRLYILLRKRELRFPSEAWVNTTREGLPIRHCPELDVAEVTKLWQVVLFLSRRENGILMP